MDEIIGACILIVADNPSEVMMEVNLLKADVCKKKEKKGGDRKKKKQVNIGIILWKLITITCIHFIKIFFVDDLICFLINFLGYVVHSKKIYTGM